MLTVNIIANTTNAEYESYTVQENVFGFLYGYEAYFQGLFNRKSQNGNRKSYIYYDLVSVSITAQ